MTREGYPNFGHGSIFLYNRKFCWNYLLYKKSSGQGCTASERNYIAEALCRRRRIPQVNSFYRNFIKIWKKQQIFGTIIIDNIVSI